MIVNPPTTFQILHIEDDPTVGFYLNGKLLKKEVSLNPEFTSYIEHFFMRYGDIFGFKVLSIHKSYSWYEELGKIFPEHIDPSMGKYIVVSTSNDWQRKA